MVGVRRKKIIAISTITTFLWIFFRRSNLTENHDIIEKQIQRNRDENNRTFILLWRRPWGIATEGWREGAVFENCRITLKRKWLKDSAAVIFHYTGLDEETVPWQHYRDEEQAFIFYSMESPSYIYNFESRKDFDKFNGHFINWTMTYRSDADVFFSYLQTDELRSFLEGWRGRIDDMLATKNRVALWLVSNCHRTTGAKYRMIYVNRLIEAGLPVDRFGDCFNNSGKFRHMPSREKFSYKFYLAFENVRYCNDYITEKFWTNGILWWRVPVVMGARKQDVIKLVPSNSFIHVDDFANLADLVAYLLELNQNQEEYRKYFRWLEDPDPHTLAVLKRYQPNGMHLLCDMITSQTVQKKSVKDVTNYLFKRENPACFRN